MPEFVKPDIFDNHRVICGMTIKGNEVSFPPCGFSFRQLSHTNEEFQSHEDSMEKYLGRGIGKRIVATYQEHGSTIQDAGLDILSNGDGLHTNDSSIMLGIALADCCGIMIYDPKNHAIMALHAGWRGAKAGIASKGIEIMHKSYGANPEDLLIWLTPCAGVASYEVGEEFVDYFPGFVKNMNGRLCFDLRGYLNQTLIQAGVKPQAIEKSCICTIQEHSFHSFRREGNLGRNLAFLGLV